MKTFYLSLILVFTFNNSFTQDEQNTDSTLSLKVVGIWEHMSSSYPSEDIITFQRELHLFADGKGLCIDINSMDTILVTFEWEVIDSTIFLFVHNKNGRRIDTDSQNIYLLNQNKMYLAEIIDGTVETGKVCYYRRKNMEIANN